MRLAVVAEQDSRGRNTLLLRNLDNRLGSHDGATGAAKGTVGLNVNALLLAEVDNLLLRETGVVLDLVDGGDDSRMRQKLLEVLLAVLYRVLADNGGLKVNNIRCRHRHHGSCQ